MLLIGSHIEVTFPLGRRELVSAAAYLKMTADELAGTKVRAMTRVEVIARLAARRS